MSKFIEQYRFKEFSESLDEPLNSNSSQDSN